MSCDDSLAEMRIFKDSELPWSTYHPHIQESLQQPAVSTTTDGSCPIPRSTKIGFWLLSQDIF